MAKKYTVKDIALIRDWKLNSLEILYNFKYGQFNNNPSNGGVYPVYGANGVIGRYTNFNAESSMIIGHMGENAGSVFWEDGKHFVTYNGTIAVPKDENELDPKYGYYYLLNFNLNRICLGSGQPFLSYADLNRIQICYPSIKEQKKIANFLSSLDRKIALNLRKIAAMEAMAKQLYEYWFVQFNFPDVENKPYKSAGGNMIYNEILKMKIPSGWEVKCFNEICTNPTDSINPQDNLDVTYKHYSIPGYDKFGTYVEELGAEIKSDKYTPKQSDILASKLNPWANRVVWCTDCENQICSTEFIVFRTNEPEFKGFVYQTLRDERYVAYASKAAVGTSNSHKRVTPSIMFDFAFPFKEDIVKKYSKIVKKMHEQTSLLLENTRQLTNLRDELLPLLMNGQVSIKNHEKNETKGI